MTVTKYNLKGVLELADIDSNDNYEYILKENDGFQNCNLSHILNSLCESESNIKIHIFTDKTTRLIAEGIIYKQIDIYGVDSWFVYDRNLDEWLFEHTGLSMNIEIIDMGAEK